MGSLFGGGKTEVKATRAPTEGDAATQDAERRTRAAAMARSGRASTVLSRNNSSSNSSGGAGTTSYGNSLLGSAG